MVKLYVVRHGETNSNVRHTCIGHKDVPLNETGRAQAERLAEKLRDVPLDAIYASPLSRAVDTATPTAEMKGLNITTVDDLIERDFGDWDDMTYEEIEQKDPELYAEWRSDRQGTAFKIPNGESSDEVHKRVGDAVNRIIAENDGKSVLIVTHLGAARHIISNVLNLTAEQSWRFTLYNATVACLEIDEKSRVLTKLNL